MAVNAVDLDPSCWHVDLSEASPELPDGTGGERDVLDITLPTPSDSGCPSITGGSRNVLDEKAGDVWGYRVALRNVLALVLWVGVAMRLVRTFVPGADESSELETIG